MDKTRSHITRGSMNHTIIHDPKRLLEEEDDDDVSHALPESDEDEKFSQKAPALRMKKIDIETIYPQAEKDREGEKLKMLCDIAQD